MYFPKRSSQKVHRCSKPEQCECNPFFPNVMTMNSCSQKFTIMLACMWFEFYITSNNFTEVHRGSHQFTTRKQRVAPKFTKDMTMNSSSHKFTNIHNQKASSATQIHKGYDNEYRCSQKFDNHKAAFTKQKEMSKLSFKNMYILYSDIYTNQYSSINNIHRTI